MQPYSNYSNKDDVTVTSTTQPDSLWSMGNYSHLPVPQSTYPDPGFYVPGFNAADNAAFSLAPNAEMGAFTNLSTDFTSQNLLDPWSMPGPSLDFNAAGNAAFSLGPSTEMGTISSLPTQADFTKQNLLDPWSMPGPSLDFNAAGNAAFSLGPSTEMGTISSLPTQADLTKQNLLDPWSMPGLSTFDGTSAVSQPQLFGAPHWTGAAPAAAYSVAATPESGVSPTSTTPTSQGEWASLSDFLQSSYTTPASSPGHGGEAGWIGPEQRAKVSGVTTSPAGWNASGPSWTIPAAPGDVTNVTETFTPAAALGKRRREADQPLGDGGLATHTDEVPPSKRARGGGSARGILKAARTRHKPAARIPEQGLISKPKEAGRGAERLATPSSQGIYHQSLPGPSFQQGWAVGAADGTPTWVEGSVDEKEVNHIDNVQQQQEGATNFFVIPRKFKQEYWLLLQTSEADVARGAVQVIRCRLCPGRVIKNFDEFKRHCETSERHPQKIHFCDLCGDFFARPDSLKRHHSLPPAECLKVTQVEALEKRKVTVQVHEDFIWWMDHALKTGEGIERGFSEIIKERYPKSSKKRTGGRK